MQLLYHRQVNSSAEYEIRSVLELKIFSATSGAVRKISWNAVSEDADNSTVHVIQTLMAGVIRLLGQLWGIGSVRAFPLDPRTAENSVRYGE